MDLPQKLWRWLAVALIAVAIGACSGSTAVHPGWSRAAIVSAAAKLLGETDLQLQKVAQIPTPLFLLDPAEKESCFSGPGEEVVAFPTGEFGSATLFGTPEHTHTVWLYFAIGDVPAAEQDKAMVFYQGMLRALFPDWSGSAAWPRDSWMASWRAAEKASSDATVSVKDTIVRQEVMGAKLATSGIPPVVVLYRITARPDCERISP